MYLEHSLDKTSSLVLLVFMFLSPFSIYYRFYTYYLLIFMIISGGLVVIQKPILRIKRENTILSFWYIYLILSLLSTVIFKQYNYLSAVLLGIGITIVVYLLTINWDKDYFFKGFKKIVCLIGIITIVGVILKKDVFIFVRQGNPSIDIFTNGNAAIFEYRHYYGVVLIAAFLIDLVYPFKNKIINFLVLCIIGINIILTYTRSTWLSLGVVVILYLLKNFKWSKLLNTNNFLKTFLYVTIVIIVILWFYKSFQSVIDNIVLRLSNIGEGYGVRSYSISSGTKFIFDNWEQYLLLGGGNGFALEWLKSNPYGLVRWTTAVDVQYVSTLMDVGILGFGSLIGILIMTVKTLITTKDKNQILGTLFLISLFVNMWYFDFLNFYCSPYIWWIISIFIVSRNQIKPKKYK